MSQINSPINVKLDNRVHRVVTLGQPICNKKGYTVTLDSETDATGKSQDFITIKNAVDTKKFRCTGSYMPPAKGPEIPLDEKNEHVSKNSLFPDKHRVILLGTNILGDAEYGMTLVNNGLPDLDHRNDVLLYQADDSTNEFPADGGGNKIPPDTGE